MVHQSELRRPRPLHACDCLTKYAARQMPGSEWAAAACAEPGWSALWTRPAVQLSCLALAMTADASSVATNEAQPVVASALASAFSKVRRTAVDPVPPPLLLLGTCWPPGVLRYWQHAAQTVACCADSSVSERGCLPMHFASQHICM